MLKRYDPWEYSYHSFEWQQEGEKPHYYASDLRDDLEITQEEEFRSAIERALKVCRTLAISIEDNFKTVYRFESNALVHDWKLSNLACYLIIVNSNPENKRVAKAQLYFAVKR